MHILSFHRDATNCVLAVLFAVFKALAVKEGEHRACKDPGTENFQKDV